MMLDQAGILLQIAQDTRTLSELLTVFASDYLAPVFEKHPELPSADITITIDNSTPGAPIVEVRTHFHMSNPELSVLKLKIQKANTRLLLASAGYGAGQWCGEAGGLAAGVGGGARLFSRGCAAVPRRGGACGGGEV